MLRRFSPLVLGVIVVLTGVLVLAAMQLATRSYLREGHDRAEVTLRLTIQALDGYLRRFEAVPDLLADYEAIRRAVARPEDPAQRMATNRWLKAENDSLQASDIYVMTPDGVTVAASNYDRADSFIGQNFSYRPYFIDAMAGGKGQFFALGTTSGVRGYYFSEPIHDAQGRVSGVIVVKISLDQIEAEWRTQDYRILVTDPEGIVFLSTDPGWLYAGLLPLTEQRLARTTASRRYSDAVLSELPHRSSREQGLPIMALAGADGGTHEYLVASQLMPLADWTVHVLLDTAYLRGQARLAVVSFLLLLGVAVSVGLIFLQRRAQLADRIAMQEQTKAELERRVDERTADLARVNRQIETEIAERRLTEQELRRTQADLVQAGKLAALGTMSAALSHEINQPLAAARNYADSATILIDRGDAGRARENVTQITALIDRMAAIARHLREVARKPDAPMQDVALSPAVEEACRTVSARLASARAEVAADLPSGLAVRADPGRLQQVLVNILANAADAVEESADRRITLSARLIEGRVHLAIRDHGPGVPTAIADRIFDPFFTTKRVGSGLGLGLSISYNILKDFGGELRVMNDPGGGAVFTLILHPAAAKALAAE